MRKMTIAGRQKFYRCTGPGQVGPKTSGLPAIRPWKVRGFRRVPALGRFHRLGAPFAQCIKWRGSGWLLASA
ncbi:MAG TPA: hypothetical protein VGG64_03370, partial [Pirellulales bacterium]